MIQNSIALAQYYLNTLTICVLTFGIQVVTSTLAAYALAFYNVKGIKLVFVVIFMQIIIPNDVLIIPNFMTLSKMGLMHFDGDYVQLLKEAHFSVVKSEF